MEVKCWHNVSVLPFTKYLEYLISLLIRLPMPILTIFLFSHQKAPLMTVKLSDFRQSKHNKGCGLEGSRRERFKRKWNKCSVLHRQSRDTNRNIKRFLENQLRCDQWVMYFQGIWFYGIDICTHSFSFNEVVIRW